MSFSRELDSFLQGGVSAPGTGDTPAAVPAAPRQAPGEPPPHVLDHLAGRIALHRGRHASENAAAPGGCGSVVDTFDMGATPGGADAPPLVHVRLVSPGRRGSVLERTAAFTPHLARRIALDARAIPGARVELIVDADASDEVFTHIAQEAFVLFCTRGLEVAIYRAATAKPQRHGPAPPSRAA